MLATFDKVHGENLAKLLTFLHSEDNQHSNVNVAVIKSIEALGSISSDRWNAEYKIEIDFAEKLERGVIVPSRYVQKIYDILTTDSEST